MRQAYTEREGILHNRLVLLKKCQSYESKKKKSEELFQNKDNKRVTTTKCNA